MKILHIYVWAWCFKHKNDSCLELPKGAVRDPCEGWKDGGPDKAVEIGIAEEKKLAASPNKWNRPPDGMIVSLWILLSD